MHARYDDVESGEHLGGLIESSVLVDVHLDAAENPKWWRSGFCFSGKLIVDPSISSSCRMRRSVESPLAMVRLGE
jgi:hypothetical protein